MVALSLVALVVAAATLAVALLSPNESTASSDPSLLVVPSLLLSLSEPDPEDPDPEEDVTPLDDESNIDSLSVTTVARISALLDELVDIVLRCGETAVRVLFALGALAEEPDELASEVVREFFFLEALPACLVFSEAA